MTQWSILSSSNGRYAPKTARLQIKQGSSFVDIAGSTINYPHKGVPSQGQPSVAFAGVTGSVFRVYISEGWPDDYSGSKFQLYVSEVRFKFGVLASATCGDKDGTGTAAVNDTDCGTGYVYEASKNLSTCAGTTCDAGGVDQGTCCVSCALSSCAAGKGASSTFRALEQRDGTYR